MVGIGFCEDCLIRIFKDEIEGKDYFLYENMLFCQNCVAEKGINIGKTNH